MQHQHQLVTADEPHWEVSQEGYIGRGGWEGTLTCPQQRTSPAAAETTTLPNHPQEGMSDPFTASRAAPSSDAPPSPRPGRIPLPRSSGSLPPRQPIGDIFPSACAPAYILTVDPLPPSYPPASPPAYLASSRGIEHELELASPAGSTAELVLPTYHATPTTDPHTFARTMFKSYNPLCWLLGAYTLFVEMRPPAEGEIGYDEFVQRTGIREAVEPALVGVGHDERGKVRAAMEKQRIDEQVRLIGEVSLRGGSGGMQTDGPPL